jgi:transposase-like protein
MGRAKVRYTLVEKEKIVAFAYSTPLNVKEAGRRYGVAPSNIRNWAKTIQAARNARSPSTFKKSRSRLSLNRGKSAKPAQSNIPVEASVEDNAPSKEPGHVNVAALQAAAVAQDSEPTVEKRRGVLNEVREHLELLKEFEGVVPEEELKKRKRALFLALPDAPPPFERKAKCIE